MRSEMVGVGDQVSFDVIVRREFDGTFIAEIPALAGCFAGGDTLDAAVATLVEVLPVYLEAIEGMDVHITKVEQVEGPQAAPVGDDDQVVARRELILA